MQKQLSARPGYVLALAIAIFSYTLYLGMDTGANAMLAERSFTYATEAHKTAAEAEHINDKLIVELENCLQLNGGTQ